LNFFFEIKIALQEDESDPRRKTKLLSARRSAQLQEISGQVITLSGSLQLRKLKIWRQLFSLCSHKRAAVIFYTDG